MELWEEYLGSSYEMVDVLKDSEEGLVALIYDKVGKQVSILKQRDIRSKGIYEMLKELGDSHIPAIYRLMGSCWSLRNTLTAGRWQISCVMMTGSWMRGLHSMF